MEDIDTRQVEYCTSCKSNFVYKPDETFFDDHGCNYSTKLVKCPDCGKDVVIKYYRDKSLNLNYDTRYYI